MERLIHRPGFIVLTLVLILAEALWRVRVARRGYDFKAAAASYGVAAGNLFIKAMTRGLIASVLFAAFELSPMKLSAGDWRVWALAFPLVEFVYYWFHRWSHEVRWLWASHAVHHSATELVLPAAIRLGWTDFVSGGWLLFMPLALLGFPPLVIGGLLAGNLAFQFLLHTEAVGTLGPLEWVFNTPAHHRVHHASNEAYIDKNFGGVLIVFDRMFGTFAKADGKEKLRYGLVHSLSSKNPFVIAFHEWGRMFHDVRAAGSVPALAKALFGRPV